MAEQLRVLIVDDEASLREPLAKHLRKNHLYHVDTAATAEEALNKVDTANGNYDVALIDDMLMPQDGADPEQLGITLMTQIQVRYPHIEYILFTGWGMKSAIEALRAGAFRYLRKPFDPEELGMLIQHAAEYRRLKGAAYTGQILEQLMKQSLELFRERDLQATFTKILGGAQAIGFDRVRFYLLSEDRTRLVGQAQAGMDTEFVGLELPITDDPYMQYVLNNPQPQIFTRTEDTSVPYEQVLAKESVTQWACVPLLFQGQVIGKLSADNKYSHKPINDTELELFKLFAAHASATLENAQLVRTEQKTMDRAKAIQKITIAISSLHQLEDILNTTCNAAVELFGVDHSGLVLFDRTYTSGHVAAEYPDRGTYGIRIPIKGIPGEEQLIKSKQPLVIPDVAQATSFGVVAEMLQQLNICSMLIVPVVFQEEVLGSFSLDQIGQTREFSQDEIDSCIIFAAQVAAAVKNAQLLESVQQHANQLEKLSQTTLAITSELDRTTLLRSIIQQAVGLLNAKSGGIYEYYPERGNLVIIADDGHFQSVLGNELRVGEGMAGRLVQSEEPYLIAEDYSKWLGHSPKYAAIRPFGAVIEVPLKWQQRIVGVLYIDDEVGRKFTADDADVLRLCADHAAIALINAEVTAQLTEQKDHLARVVASSPDGVIVVDEHGCIKDLNARAQEILGYRLDEIAKQSVSMLYDNAQEARNVGALLRQSPDGKLTNYRSYVRNKQGIRIPVSLAATWLYDVQNQRIGSVGYFEDLRATDDAERRQRLLLQASNIVAQANNLFDGLQSLTDMIVHFLDVTFCHIYLLDESHSFLVPQAMYPAPGERPGWSPRIETLAVGGSWAELYTFLQQGVPERLESITKQHQHQLKLWSQRLALKQEIQSLLMIPLRTHNNIVGLLFIGELRHRTRSPLSEEKEELAIAISDQTVVLIDRIRLHEATEHRRQLLASLDERSLHLGAQKDARKLVQETVRLATELLNGTAAGLCRYRSNQRELEIVAVHQLPGELCGLRLSDTETALGKVARTGQSIKDNKYIYQPDREALLRSDVQSFVAVPLRQPGKVEDVLFVVSTSTLRHFSETDVEILERFAARAFLALQTSELLNLEQRTLTQRTILHQISTYIQAARDLDKILHVVLTGVTAGYGLGFNRAALLLLDEHREYLIGRVGVGHLDEVAARKDWQDHQSRGLEDFQHYIELLEQDRIPITPLHARVRKLHLPFDEKALSFFALAAAEPRGVLLSEIQLAQLPSAFVQAFQPALPLVVVRLTVRDQIIGVLVADNKFTASPITPDDLESLLTFASTAAIAIDNTRLLHEKSTSEEQLRSLFKASNTLISNQEPHQVLRDIVDQTRVAANAASVSIVLIDAIGGTQDIIMAGIDTQPNSKELIRPHGISMQVMKTGKFERIEDVQQKRVQVNPRMFENGTKAALCLPVLLRGKRIGVMWIHYNTPQLFSDALVDAIQLYVNQAAIAYDNARHITELENMRRATEALAGAVNSQEVLEQIVHSSRNVLHTDSAAFWSFDDVRNRFIPRGSVVTGIPLDLWEQARKDEPRPGGTAYTIMDRGWVNVHNVADSEQYPFLGTSTRALLTSMGVRSFHGIVLQVGDEKLGILYLNYNRLRNFSEDEQEIARTFAHHAALALKKARLLDQLSKARNTARVVAEVTVLGNDLEDTLRSVTEGTLDALGCHAVTAYIYDHHKGHLRNKPITVGVTHPDRAATMSAIPEQSIVLEMLRRDRMYLVEDTSTDELFADRRFTTEEGIVSCAALPLQVNGDKVGVIFINYRSSHRFTADELINMELFANQAAVAIQNAQLYQEVRTQLEKLEQTKDMLAARTALAWMGMVSSTWRHSLSMHATTIEDIVLLANRDLDRGEVPEKLHERLDKIKLMIGKIRAMVITTPLTTEEEGGSVPINEFLRERGLQLWQNEVYAPIQLSLDFKLEHTATARISALWLRQAFDLLIDNAVEAMGDSSIKHITIATHKDGAGVEITISDTGRGIPKEVLPHLFKSQVKKHRGAKGMGIGLLMAQLIIQMHRGKLTVKTTGPNGTTIRVWLPLET